ncbi:MAG: alcohol dehydrogenase catalytic domain-containing protein, partial [Solirubrobacteraceae bacterium]
MRAAVYSRRGPAARVLRVADVPEPEPAAGEVRVRMAVSGVNPTDIRARRTARGLALPFALIIPHQDGAGVIDAVGPGVPRRRAGERVWLYNACFGRPFGTAAEAVALPSAQAQPLPDGVPFELGASLGIPALTAHRCLHAAGSPDGAQVLVAGGAGAVGHAA